MSEVKVNKISPRTNCGTVTLGDSGDTFTIPAGVTISNSGTASGFGSSGEISWDTTVKTGDFTGVSGVGYFVNTAGGTVTVTLPSSPSAGNVIGISSYNNSASTNPITVARNGSNILGSAENFTIAKGNSAVQFIYVDGTVGWQTVFTGSPSDVQNAFISATGGTVTESGDFKIHTFTGPGTFTVNNGGSAAGSNTVSYTVVGGGGGGGGGSGLGGGGGAGGFRESKASSDSYTASPLNATSGPTYNLPVTGGTGYPIVVGAGGTGVSPQTRGNPGVNSSFSTITSAGGGGGGGKTGSCITGLAGGSGGGGGENSGALGCGGGAGNTPSVSPPQGQNGATGYGGSPGASAGGGGGAGAAGQAGQPGSGGAGGAGVATSITGSPVTRAGGGGGAGYLRSPGSGGSGGGGNGSSNPVPADATAGTANTGGGGGGGVLTSTPEGNGAAGGSGIVVIRYKFQ